MGQRDKHLRTRIPLRKITCPLLGTCSWLWMLRASPSWLGLPDQTALRLAGLRAPADSSRVQWETGEVTAGEM